MYFPRATSSGVAAIAGAAESRSSNAPAAMIPMAFVQTRTVTESSNHSTQWRLAAVGDVVLLLVPEHPQPLSLLACDLAVLGGWTRGGHEHFLQLGQAPLPRPGLARATDHGQAVVGAHDHRAVPVETEAHAAIAHGDTCRSCDHLDGRLRMDTRRHGHPEPPTIESQGDRAPRTQRRQNEDLRQRRKPDGVAAARSERGPHGWTRSHSVAHAELVA